jgi:hypothetical protein
VRVSAPARLSGSMPLCSAESGRHSAEAAPGLAYDEMPDAAQALLEQTTPLVLEVDVCEPAPA